MKADTLFLCFLSLIVLIVACGKKGDPQPQDQKNLFVWQSEEARLSNNGCLIIAAKMCGAVVNVDGISLEIEPLAINQATNQDLPPEITTFPDTCEGCPFMPRETTEISPQTQNVEDDCVNYAITYCPTLHADTYRWRLVARNVFRAFPFVLTPVHTTRSVTLDPKN